jgi:hypothetical protein
MENQFPITFEKFLAEAAYLFHLVLVISLVCRMRGDLLGIKNIILLFIPIVGPLILYRNSKGSEDGAS